MNNWDGIISLLIACMEFLLLANLMFFSEKNKTNVIAMFTILVLALYQSFEYAICGLEYNSSFMAYLAFADISLLPPLNLILVLSLLFRINKKFYLLFLPAAFFIIYYAVVIEQFEVVRCTVVYATYNYPLGDLYGFFYYMPILISFLILLKKREALDKKQFYRLLIAHLFITIPVAVGFTLLYLGFPTLIASMESILCKFAFGYAICLALFILNNKSGTDERNHT